MTQAVALEPDVVIGPQTGDDTLYEVVNGHRMEMPPMSAYEVGITSLLTESLGSFVRAHQLGRTFGEMLFVLDGDRKLQRRPDVAFVSYQTWPQGRPIPRTNAWEVVPELAVEVVSPTNFAEEVVGRVLEFFHAGVREVWVVYPGPRQVYVYRSPTAIQVLTRADAIDGAPLLPGFKLPVAALFEEEGAPA
jgi:Uma2 family endonuclease